LLLLLPAAAVAAAVAAVVAAASSPKKAKREPKPREPRRGDPTDEQIMRYLQTDPPKAW
jgi:hypothetical protein